VTERVMEWARKRGIDPEQAVKWAGREKVGLETGSGGHILGEEVRRELGMRGWARWVMWKREKEELLGVTSGVVKTGGGEGEKYRYAVGAKSAVRVGERIRYTVGDKTLDRQKLGVAREESLTEMVRREMGEVEEVKAEEGKVEEKGAEKPGGIYTKMTEKTKGGRRVTSFPFPMLHVGTDIVEISRIEKILQGSTGVKFLKRILTEEEGLALWRGKGSATEMVWEDWLIFLEELKMEKTLGRIAGR